jgi:flagellar L-ring protein precursor FlgH
MITLLLFSLNAAAQEAEVTPVEGEIETTTTAPSDAPEEAPQVASAARVGVEGRMLRIAGRSPGSIWVETEALQLLGLEGNARQVGDLITVKVTERTSTAVDSETKTGRSSKVGAGISALFGIETSLLAANPNMGESISMDVTGERDFEGRGSTSRGATASTTITCEVVEVLESGNLRIMGEKQVRVNQEIQYVVLKGIVRPQDIQMDNTVSSDLVARAEIEISGRGVVSDPQRPGMGTRILDRAWPF